MHIVLEQLSSSSQVVIDCNCGESILEDWFVHDYWDFRSGVTPYFSIFRPISLCSQGIDLFGSSRREV
jgi:hypothetical protein